MDMKNINILIPADLHSDLKLLALRHGHTLRSLIIKILTDYILAMQEKERGEK